MSYDVKILADSVAAGVRLTTLSATYPRIIHAELMTHRVFSRNAASSRAIPVEKSIERVLADPFVPEAFAANKKGMQGGEALDEAAHRRAREAWTTAMYSAVNQARDLADTGVHKHWANRLLEPYAWITTVITATEWDNFFALRCHPAAAPEFQKIAGMMRDARAASTPNPLPVNAWHLPFVTTEDYEEQTRVNVEWAALVKLSVARCARVSYLTHEGKRDVDADLALYEKLLTSGHLSPFEHAARVLDPNVACVAPFFGNLKAPWFQHRKDLEGEAVFRG